MGSQIDWEEAIRRIISRVASLTPTKIDLLMMLCPMCSSERPGMAAIGATLA